MNKRNLITALAFPVIVLVALIFYKQAKVMIGKEIILPVSGFDPRDILSGHYLTYSIDYGIRNSNFCNERSNDNYVYICLYKDNRVPDKYLADLNSDPYDSECTAIIKGKCKNGRFYAGIERFYIPEEYAYSLDRAVSNRQGKIVLSVSGNGSAAIKDLLIDGKSWKEYKDR